jgi:hypothetical protein
MIMIERAQNWFEVDWVGDVLVVYQDGSMTADDNRCLCIPGDVHDMSVQQDGTIEACTDEGVFRIYGDWPATKDCTVVKKVRCQ